MKRPKKNRWIAGAFALLGAMCAGCVSARQPASPVPLIAEASVPSPEETRAREEEEAKAQRRAFVDAELRWILGTGAPGHSETVYTPK